MIKIKYEIKTKMIEIKIKNIYVYLKRLQI